MAISLGVLFLVLIAILIWPAHRPNFASTTYPLLTTGIALPAALIGVYQTPSKRTMLVYVLIGGVLLVTGFTSIYYLIAPTNFNHPMSRLGALYFTLGTLTTAGTGNLSPLTDSARTFVSIQYVVDIIYAVIIIGIAGGRLNSDIWAADAASSKASSGRTQ